MTATDWGQFRLLARFERTRCLTGSIGMFYTFAPSSYLYASRLESGMTTIVGTCIYRCLSHCSQVGHFLIFTQHSTLSAFLGEVQYKATVIGRLIINHFLNMGRGHYDIGGVLKPMGPQRPDPKKTRTVSPVPCGSMMSPVPQYISVQHQKRADRGF